MNLARRVALALLVVLAALCCFPTMATARPSTSSGGPSSFSEARVDALGPHSPAGDPWRYGDFEVASDKVHTYYVSGAAGQPGVLVHNTSMRALMRHARKGTGMWRGGWTKPKGWQLPRDGTWVGQRGHGLFKLSSGGHRDHAHCGQWVHASFVVGSGPRRGTPQPYP
ncbi:MAG: hypothetical protein M9894_12785 [Planctomycetes bacterium]|nr:hypothetical protein [Planctomycetota bacterium]